MVRQRARRRAGRRSSPVVLALVAAAALAGCRCDDRRGGSDGAPGSRAPAEGRETAERPAPEGRPASDLHGEALEQGRAGAASRARRYGLIGLEHEAGRAVLRHFDRDPGSAELEYVIAEVRSGQVLERQSLPTLAAIFSFGELPEGGRLRDLPSPGSRLVKADLRAELGAYLPVLRLGGGPWREEHLAVSFDGRQVLLAGGDWLYASHDGGTSFRRVGPELGAAYRPVVSPDGRYAAFSACDRPCRGYSLRLLELRAGSRPVKVAAVGSPGEDLAWSPDGRTLYAVRGDAEPDGPSARGCLVRLRVDRPAEVTEVACVQYPSYAIGAGFKVSGDGRLGVLIGREPHPTSPRTSYAWVDLETGEQAGTGSIATAGPLFPSVHGSGLLAWVEDAGPGSIVLELATGTIRRVAARGSSLAFWDERTLVVATGGEPAVELVPIAPE